MARDISPRKRPLDDDFTAADYEDDKTPVVDTRPKNGAKKNKDKSKTKSKTKPVSEAEDYFANIVDEESDDTPVPAGKKVQKVKSSDLTQETVNLDKRKLTKVDSKKLEIWKGSERPAAMDAFMAAHVERARAKLGHRSIFLGDESNSLVVCVPMFGGHDANAAKYPGCLPLEFAIAQDGFPLGLVIQLVALYGVGKSAMLAEFGRWFNLAGGMFELNENETKYNPRWYRSILGKDSFLRMPLHRCVSVEDWQKHLTFGIKDMKTHMIGTKEKPGPGPIFPVLYGVDSIMGKLSEKSQETILGKIGAQGERGTTGEGSARRGWPEEALVITRYMRAIPGEFDNWPFALVLVNHLRIKQDDMGNAERNKAGGEQVNFQESFELELHKMGGQKKKIQCTEWEGYPIGISCEKNSFGPTHRFVQTRMIWWEVDDGRGGWEQKTIIDWDWGTIHLLNNMLRGEKCNPRLRNNLKDMNFHLECPSTAEIENKAWSKNLGMKANDALPWTEVGALIRQDQKLQNQLRDALRINRRPLLYGSYSHQLNQLSEKLL